MARREETATMKKDTPALVNVIEIYEARIKDHLGSWFGAQWKIHSTPCWMPRLVGNSMRPATNVARPGETSVLVATNAPCTPGPMK